jgi:hypothetical protein
VTSSLHLFRERVSVLDDELNNGSQENTARGVPNERSMTQSPMMNMKRILKDSESDFQSLDANTGNE